MSENETLSRPAAPERVVDHPVWREALGAARAALSRPRAVVAVLGAAGNGKTWLLRALLSELRAEGRDAVLLARGDAETRPAPPGGPGVILVDEADRLDPPTLRALAEAGARGVVLAALPGFAAQLDAVAGAVVVTLRTLRPDEAASFVRARLAASGTPDRIADDAVAEVVANGAGIPRMLSGLLIAAEFVASLQGASTVTVEHVREAVLLRGDFGVGPEAEPGAAPAPPPAAPDESEPEPTVADVGGETRGPDPDERWVENAAATPARQRAGRWAVVLACAAVASLFVAYAARQPFGERLVRQASALLPERDAALPAAGAASASSAPAPVPVEVAATQAAGHVPPASLPGAGAAGGGAGVIRAASLPLGVVPHVVLSYRLGDAGAERRAFAAARSLRDAGIAANDPVPVPRPIAEPGLTYFFAEDRASAAAIGRALGGAFGGGRAAALHPGEPLPRPGTIEVQVSSEQAEAGEPAR